MEKILKWIHSRGRKDKDVFREIWEAEEEPRNNLRKQKLWPQDLIQTMGKTRKTGNELFRKVKEIQEDSKKEHEEE